MKDLNRPDVVLIDKENETALVIDTAVPLTHTLPNIEAWKTTKRENFALEIKNVWKLNDECIYPLVISVEGVATKNFLNIYRILL
jgi:hypothetical protein